MYFSNYAEMSENDVKKYDFFPAYFYKRRLNLV